MIQIDKSTVTVPSILTVTGLAARIAFQNEFDANPAGHTAVFPNKPVAVFNFDNRIYGCNDVKDELLNAQNGKCCFCESKMRHVSDGDVEHFRPKGRWKQKNGEPINYPGYYWKAYDWDNLFLACQRCNQREKQDLFPLATGSSRATNHNININVERPLFVHPELDNPEDEIEFIDQYVKHKTPRGKATIDDIGLDRGDLDNFREEKLDDLLALEDSYITSIGHPNEIRTRDNFFNRLRHYVSEGGEYSNMFKCNFRKYLAQL